MCQGKCVSRWPHVEGRSNANKRKIKKRLATFTASNCWLETFKQTYGLRETRITGEADDIPKMTIQSWIERLPELTSGYELRTIWNMDELGLFFKALPEKDLVEKSRCKGGKKSRQFLTAAFFCSSQWFKNFRICCNLEE